MIKKVVILNVFALALFAQNLTWLKEADTRMSWKDAVKYCEDRKAVLPSKKQFKKIWHDSNKSSDLPGFEISVSYWTSTLVKGNKLAAYPFYFGDGREDWYYKADHYGVRCIKK